jgi:glucuronate isomerase
MYEKVYDKVWKDLRKTKYSVHDTIQVMQLSVLIITESKTDYLQHPNNLYQTLMLNLG